MLIDQMLSILDANCIDNKNNCFFFRRRLVRIIRWLSIWTTECASFCRTRVRLSVHLRHSTNTWTWSWVTAKSSEKSDQRTANCRNVKRNGFLVSYCCVAKTSFRWQSKDHHHQRKVCHEFQFQALLQDQESVVLLAVAFQPLYQV